MHPRELLTESSKKLYALVNDDIVDIEILKVVVSRLNLAIELMTPHAENNFFIEIQEKPF